MLSLITRAATLLKIVLVIQLIAAIGIVSLFVPDMGSAVNLGAWPLTALWVALAFIAIRVTIVAIQFLITTLAASSTPQGHRLGLASALTTFWHECTASLTSFVWTMPFRSGVTMPQPNQTGVAIKIPVLLIHGYGCNRGMWRHFAQGLADNGHPNEAINLEPVLGSIDDYVKDIEAGVTSLLQRTGAQQVALVAHSMGGLASRAFMSQSTLIQNNRIAKIITLGTPHQGTVLAIAGQGTNTKQMRRKSIWLKKLSEHERSTDIDKLVCILSHQDNIAAPQSDQFVKGAKVIEMSAIGHVAMAYSPKTLALVCQELA